MNSSVLAVNESQPAAPALQVETACGFDVHIARTEADLADACRVRQAGYAHHLGDGSAGFAVIDPLDRATGTVVFICRDHTSGEAVGTVRIQTGHARHPLQIERNLILPHGITRGMRGEVARLAVLPGTDAKVKLSLMRAVYQYAYRHGLDWLVIAARNDALARTYRRLGFVDFLAPGQKLPLACAGNIPHYIFTMDVRAVRGAWQGSGHRLLGFMLDGLEPGPADAHSRSQLAAQPCFQMA